MEAPWKAWRKRGKHGKFSVASVARARWWEDRLRKWKEGRRGEEQLPFQGPQESGLLLEISA